MGWIKLLPGLLLCVLLKLANGDSIVQTENGPIRGKTVASGKVEAFLGIPYAEPPVGPLRFSKPVSKISWHDVLDATKLPPACIQMNLSDAIFAADVSTVSEDCLHLNVWMPLSKSKNELKTIMLFIPGGGFMVGSSNIGIYDGANLAQHGDVVVVTINYRVGAMGFLTGFTEDAPGSQGLYDQVMALQWIKDNAKHFQGDTDNIVIFGESAGSYSVSMHQISPLSKNLFKRAILQSGSSINPQYTEKNEISSEISLMYASLLGCTDDDNILTNDVIACLRNVPVKKFIEADMEVFRRRSNIPVPTIGNDFLPQNTIDSFRKGHFKNSEVLMGITRDEGTVLLFIQNPELLGWLNKKDLKYSFNKTTAYNAIKLLLGNGDTIEDDKIIQSYLDDVNEDTGYTYLKAVTDAFGDVIIICGSIFQAEYHSMRGNPLFFYMFDHRTTSAPYADWIGVPHFEEVQYVFGNPTSDFTEFEVELSRDIMDMWVTFAKTGNPNIPGSLTWPRYTYKDPKYYVIGKRDTVLQRPDHKRCERLRNRFRSSIDDSVIEALKKHWEFDSQ